MFTGLVACGQGDKLLEEILDEIAKKETSDLSHKSEHHKKLEGKTILSYLSKNWQS